MYEIRNDIPLLKPRERKYQWSKLEAGQSIQIPFGENGDESAFRHAVTSAFVYQAKQRKADKKIQFRTKSYPATPRYAPGGYGIIQRVE